MKVTGYANLFARKVNKAGKVYTFPEVSVSSKDVDGNFKSINLKVVFKKDITNVEVLEENKCYNIEIKDAILNVTYDDYLKRNVFYLFINDFEYVKTKEFGSKKEEKPNKKLPK